MKGFLAWILAIGLHIGLFIMLIGWPAFYSMQSLPRNNPSIAAYFQASSNGNNRIALQKNAMAYGDNKAGSAKASSTALAIRQLQTQAIAPVQIQVLLKMIAESIQQHLTYPASAQDQIQQGSAVIDFRLSPDGEISQIRLIQSSGSQDLDQAALQAVKASSPIIMPISIKQSIRLSLPVDFTLN